MFAPPLALATNIAGILHDERKQYAIAGLIISGVTCALIGLLFIGVLL